VPEEGQSIVEFGCASERAAGRGPCQKYQTDGALMMVLRGRTLHNFKDWVRYTDWACVVFIVASVAFACSVVFIR
jgi:hypothetical protein